MSSQYPGQVSYQPQYETAPPSMYTPPPRRGPRYSVPSTSSGFMPISHPSEPSGFNGPPPSHTPAPYSQSHFHPQPGFPVSSQTPAPSYPPIAASTSNHSFNHQPSFPPSQSFQYTQFTPPAPAPSPQQYLPPAQSHSPARIAHLQNNYGYNMTGSPTRESASPPVQNGQLSSSVSGSRPLPQPHVYPNQQAYGVPFPSGQPDQAAYNPTQNGMYVPLNSNSYQDGYQAPPPPPPPPPSTNSSSDLQSPPQSYSPPEGHNPHLPPPPPPPPSQFNSNSPRRVSNFQQPSSLPLQSSGFQPLPPPPPPPIDYQYLNSPPPPPPASSFVHPTQPYYPGPPPRPPTQLDEQGQWQPPTPPQSYPQPSWA